MVLRFGPTRRGSRASEIGRLGKQIACSAAADPGLLAQASASCEHGCSLKVSAAG
jgi:hypothetical protein